jgi:hypothetical protein
MSTATLNIVSNGHFSAHQDYPSSSSAVKGININTNSSINNNTQNNNNNNSNSNNSNNINGATIHNSMNNSNHAMASYTNGFSSSFSAFGFPDSLSSSIPKSSHNNNSIHIGSLTNGLGGLSLSNYAPTTSSSLSSGLYSYNNNNTSGSSNPITTTIANTSSLLSVTNSNTPPVGANGTTLTATANGAVQEEISTIFVVGFPDDMHEREFQNMFVFTPGFEAATLKIPNKEPQEDDALTLDVNGVNPRKQIVSNLSPFLLSSIALLAILFHLCFLYWSHSTCGWAKLIRGFFYRSFFSAVVIWLFILSALFSSPKSKQMTPRMSWTTKTTQTLLLWVLYTYANKQQKKK